MKAQTLVFACVTTACGSAPGATVAYDGFAPNATGLLAGSTGGSGWTSPWVDVSSSMETTVGGAGLTYPRLRMTPGAATTPAGGSFDAAGYTRGFGPIPAPANHVFISFLLRPNAGYGTFGGLSFGGYTMIGQPLTYNTYGMRLARYAFADTGIPVVQGQTALLVLELEVVGAQTVYRLYVNPPLDQGMPATPNAQYSVGGAVLPSSLMLSNDGGFTTDELRVATTWNESVPPPTGTCFTLAGPGDKATCLGGYASFTATPSGSSGPFAYRWYHGAAILSDGPTGTGSVVEGAGTGHLLLRSVGHADEGFYFCVATDACGIVTGAPGRLRVCAADFNCDGGVDGDDVIVFFAAWDAGETAADSNGDGGVDGDDVIAFFQRWDSGC